MSFEGKKDEGLGSAKEKVGEATGDDEMRGEGTAQKTGGKLENVGDRVKGAFEDAADKVKRD